ncbi:site-2 protease family protein, partial [Candidatus Saccharibacteria bacterium]|nr:site-2 protease family protein [Candidatus Saccharibacteria bacterium]
LVIPVHLNEKGSEYTLGIRMRESNLLLHRATWSAPIVAAVNTVQLTGETYRGLWTMVKSLGSGIIKQFSFDESTRSQGASELKTVGDSVSGPVGIIGVLFPASVESGPTTLAFLAALISVSLACMNVLPIPALDGGRFTLIALFRLRKKTLTKETEEKIVARAFIFLLILIAIVTVLDITRFF